MGREVSFSLAWDPGDRDRPPAAPPVNDFRAVLAFLDDALAVDGNESSEMLLAAKAIALAQLKRNEEATVVIQGLFDVLEDRPDLLAVALAQGRRCIGLVLGQLGEHAAAEHALSDVASFYGSDEDPRLRAQAVSALRSRIRELIDLGDSDAIRNAWVSLRDAYGLEPDSRIRDHVARAGRSAAEGLFDAGHVADASKISDEVTALYESES